jgi:hypothetical protein
MKLRKAIGYAYPSSQFASELGGAGYFIQQSILREDRSWSAPYIAQGHDLFTEYNDPDLHRLLDEHDGDVSPYCMTKLKD